MRCICPGHSGIASLHDGSHEADLYVAILVVKGSQVKKGLDSLLSCLANPNQQAAGVGHRRLTCSFYGPEPCFRILHPTPEFGSGSTIVSYLMLRLQSPAVPAAC